MFRRLSTLTWAEGDNTLRNKAKKFFEFSGWLRDDRSVDAKKGVSPLLHPGQQLR